MYMLKKNILFIVGVVFVLGGFVTVVDANHSWGGYHWGRTANPFTLELGNNVSSGWDSYLATTASDWSASPVLDTVVKNGSTRPRTCKGKDGRVEVCSARYGDNGWLGIAQIWITGGEHITKGVMKVNDTYFDTAYYNTPAWKNLVMCQEVGHTLGLGHTDEVFDNPNHGTCMDYTNDPDGTIYGQLNNEHPNQHDYDQLEAIYAHLDSIDTIGSADSGGKGNGKGGGKGKPANVGQGIDLDNPSSWGEVVSTDAKGRSSVHSRELGGDQKLVTFVIWADGEHSHSE